MAQTELNQDKVVAELFAALIKDAVKAAGSSLGHAAQKLVEAIQKDLRQYLAATVTRCSYIKTLLHRDEPVLLLSLYVPTRLKIKKKIITDEIFVEELPRRKSVVVSGSAGSGKSMFMRYLFLSLCNQPGTRLPLFIELRQMNSLRSKLLLPFIHHSVVAPGATLTQAQFEDGLKKGLFVLLLDGFDEIDFDQRKVLEQQILELKEKYPETIMVVSSRPDDVFDSWAEFSVYNVEPMEKKQVIALIKKLKYDKGIASKFIKELDTHLFQTHGSFLSNPLLAIMMLITFDQYAHIPDKIHIFYEHAFDALFYRHDASKPGAYKRKTHTGLPIDDFKNCLSSFCITTYAKEKFLLSAAEVRGFLKKAFAFESKKDVDPDRFLRDLLECVCIMQKDGLFLTFTHRSFQEYFSAYFITRNPGISLPALLDQIAKRAQDSAIPMAFEMNRQLIEGQWILPKLRMIKDIAAKHDVYQNSVAYIDALYGGLRFGLGPGLLNYDYHGQNPMVSIAHGIMKLYPKRFRSIAEIIDEERDFALIEKLGAKDRMIIEEHRNDRNHTDRDPRHRRVRELRVRETDQEWFRETTAHKFFVARHEAFMAVLKEIEQDTARQKTILGDLFS